MRVTEVQGAAARARSPRLALPRVRTPRTPVQETAIAVHFVPGMRFHVFGFGVCCVCVLRHVRHRPSSTPGSVSATPCPVLT
eukprot:2617870-Rhodomonas_salina.1